VTARHSDWLAAVDQLLWKCYAIDHKIAGWDDETISRYFAYSDTPKQFVKWYALKYDLIEFDELAAARRELIS
jgi:hypothetical protein